MTQIPPKARSRPSVFAWLRGLNSLQRFGLWQVVFISVFVVAFLLGGQQTRSAVQDQLWGGTKFHRVSVQRTHALRIEPMYDRPDLVSDAALETVLEKILPRFSRSEMKPNHIEHALRTWGVEVTFSDPEVMSGEEMLLFLTDHGRYLTSWKDAAAPLIQEQPTGLRIRWGQGAGASYHHDHWLASVTEAGAPLSTPVFGKSGKGHTLEDVLQEALRDFRLDEREVEWSAMAFGLWLAPNRKWINADGRVLTFDLIAKRLMRGERRLGVCSGTHRVYSLMVLYRLDQKNQFLSERVRQDVWKYLEGVRDALITSQAEAGYWTGDWPDGESSTEQSEDAELSQKVIATGHHLEWLSIAPQELLPPDEQIAKAVNWLVDVVENQPQSKIRQQYTFYSHVGAALCQWRRVRPAEFWTESQQRN